MGLVMLQVLGKKRVTSVVKKLLQLRIGKLKNRKAPGVCGISVEMLKGGGGIVVKWLHSVIQLMWKKIEVMEDRPRAIIVPLYKKSNKWCVTITKGLVC